MPKTTAVLFVIAERIRAKERFGYRGLEAAQGPTDVVACPVNDTLIKNGARSTPQHMPRLFEALMIFFFYDLSYLPPLFI
jgi:hypothetical protein